MIPFSDRKAKVMEKQSKLELVKKRSKKNIYTPENMRSPRLQLDNIKSQKKNTLLFNNIDCGTIQIQLASEESYEQSINEDIEIDRNAILRDMKQPISPERKKKTNRTQHWQIYRTLQQIMDESLIDEEINGINIDQNTIGILSSSKKKQQQELNFKKSLQIPEIITEYEELYQRNPHIDNYNLQLIHVQGLEEIILNHKFYRDQYPLLNIRKWIVTFFNFISLLCIKIIGNLFFNLIMLFLVSFNMILYITKFYKNYYQEYQSLFDGWSLIFFWIYVVEHGIKLIGIGIVQFFKVFWNCYDIANVLIFILLISFQLILFGIYIYGSLSFDFSPLRAIRILIQLGKISIQFRKILRAFSESLKYMMEASLVVIIFCIFFANVGVHLFNELFYNRCFDIQTGIENLDEDICGWVNCPNQMTCFKSFQEIDAATNFNNFILGFVQIVRTITMDNWTDVMYYTMYTLSPMAWIYFVFVIFIVGFFAFNLIIAVLKTYYSQSVSNYKEDEINEELINNVEPLNLRFIKNCGLYNKIKTLQKVRKSMTNVEKTKDYHQQVNSIQQKEKLFSPKGDQLIQKNNNSLNKQFTQGFGQINNIQKMIKRAQTVKEKKKQQRLILSARQQRYLQDKENEALGVINQSNISFFDKCNLKSILLTRKNFTLEQTKLEQQIQGDIQGKKILNSLKQSDILAWKLDLKYMIYNSSSKKDVISEIKELIEKERKLKQQYDKVKQQNLKQYYMLDIQVNQIDLQKQKIKSQTTFQRLYSLKFENPQKQKNTTKNLYFTKFPIIKSQRKILYNIDDSSKNDVSNKSTITRKTYYEQIKKQKIYLQKSLTKVQRDKSAVFMEFPEWQEGQSYIQLNGVKWNYDACLILINRSDEFELNEDEDDYYNELDYLDQNYEKYVRIREKEFQQGFIRRHNISIQNILKMNSKIKLMSILKQLNRYDINIWIQGFLGFCKVAQYKLKSLLEEIYITIVLDIYVMVNFILISLDGYINSDLVDLINSIMTYILLGEIILKMIGLGIKNFSKKSSNIVDTIVIIMCLFQQFISLTKPDWLQSFSSEISVLRASKAFMLYRVIKYNQFIVRIMKIAQLTFKSYLNITFLLAYVIFMYAIMGLQFFVNKLDESQKIAQLHSFNSIGKSYMTVFNVITNDDTIGMLKVTAEYTDMWVALLFYILLVFGVNYVIFGLVSAQLLDAFSSELEKGDQSEQKREKILEQLGIEENINQNDTKLDTFSTEIDYDEDESFFNELKYHQHQLIKRQTLNSRRTLYQQLPETVKRLFISNQSNEFEYYKNIECEVSLFIFQFNNKFRKMCYRIIKSFIFKFIINSSICSSVATMIIVSFDDNLPSLQTNNINSIYEIHLFGVNIIISLAYILEIIAQGMLFDQGAFCRDIWRFFDILYLISYFMSFLGTAPFLQFALYLIYLRPLMMINMFNSTSGIKNAMSLSLVQILNIIGVILLVFLIFDVIAMHLYKNKMGYCDNVMNFGVGEIECINNNQRWIIHPFNFNNIINGLFTLFMIASLDGWGDVMQVCFNSNDSKYGPSPLTTQWATYIFFIAFIFIGAWFFMGFLTGVLFTEFQNYTKQLENKHLTSDQSQFLKISQLILHQSAGYSNPPKTPFRKLCYKIVFSRFYHFFFLFVLITNSLVLCMYYSSAEKLFLKQLNNGYQVLTAIFGFDTLIKLLAYGPTRYFSTYWRLIELCLSLIAITDFIYDQWWGWFDKYLEGNQYDKYFAFYRILFCVRDIRILLIIQEFKGLARLLRVLWFSMSFLIKILYIQLIAQTTYALIGKELFSHISNGSAIDDKYANFKNFINAALLMFKCTTGDDWRALLIDCSPQNYYCAIDKTQCGSNWAYPFFLSYYLFSNILIMNLFVLALVDQFENFFNKSTNAIQTFVENVDHFCNVWCKYTFETQGQTMHTKFIARFLLDLNEPLGALKGDNVWDAAKSASNFRIRANKKGYVYFNELLYETIHFTFKESVFKSGSIIGRAQMKQFDFCMKKKIKENSMDKEKLEDQDQLENSEVNLPGDQKYKYQNFNILQEYLNVLIALKTWEAYSHKLIEKTKHQEDYTEQTSGSDNEKPKLQIKQIEKNATISRNSCNRLVSIDLDDPKILRNNNLPLNLYKESKLNSNFTNIMLLEPLGKNSMQETTIQKSPSTLLDNQSRKIQIKNNILNQQPFNQQQQQKNDKQNIQSFKDVMNKIF